MVDNYRVILTQNGTSRDITSFVSGLSLKDDAEAYSVQVSFNIAVNPYDKFLPKLGLSVKDGVTLRNANTGKDVFTGFVTTKTEDGQVECRDKGFYLKNEVTAQFSGANVDTALADVCKKAGVTYQPLGGSWGATITGEYVRQQASSVIDDILEQVEGVTDKHYIHRVIDGKLVVRPYDSAVSNPTYSRPVESAFNIVNAVGDVELETTMDEMETNIIVQCDDDDTTTTLASAYDKTMGEKYGMLTKYYTVDSDSKDTAYAVLESARRNYGKLKRTAKVPKLWGNDDVIPGTLLLFNQAAYGWFLGGKWWVTAVEHTYEPYHYMSLELLEYAEPNPISVVTTSGSSTSTTTTKTLLGNFKLTFYAGDTSTASGVKPTVNHTIAVDPSVIPLGTQVYIDGWGTYTAEDTGGAIKGKIIDIFVSSNALARQYGVKYANVYKITAITTASSASTDGQKLVNIALAEEGNGGNYYTKYNKWYGMMGVAWCAIFVAWCANQAGISTSVIPKMSSVSSYLSWYKARGKFKAKGSGYQPKAGDLMIQKNNASHIGIVVKSDSSRFYTIEGNASKRVGQRNYSYSHSKLTGFCTPWG